MLTNIFALTEENKQKWIKSVYILIATTLMPYLFYEIVGHISYSVQYQSFLTKIFNEQPLQAIILYMIIIITIRLIMN
jgi:hypothetical protein